MHDEKAKKIGSATYLNKINGEYIPFEFWIGGANCTLIQTMLDKTDQKIIYIDKKNSNYTCKYNYLECRDDVIYLSLDF
jgi:hypothetical protein